jgi:ribosomal protein S18 acetylase RimI-like enzyme
MVEVPIIPMADGDARAVGRLYREAIPQAIFARMGERFTAAFFCWVQQQPCSQVWVARGSDGELLGVVAGTLDRPGIYRTIVRTHRLRIACSLLVNLYRPSVIAWIVRALHGRLVSQSDDPASVPRPAAEMLLLAVENQARGTGLARRLVRHIESQFLEWGFHETYVILTLSTNTRANAFYEKIGARLVARKRTRGYLVHEYHKDLSTPSD